MLTSVSQFKAYSSRFLQSKHPGLTAVTDTQDPNTQISISSPEDI